MLNFLWRCSFHAGKRLPLRPFRHDGRATPPALLTSELSSMRKPQASWFLSIFSAKRKRSQKGQHTRCCHNKVDQLRPLCFRLASEFVRRVAELCRCQLRESKWLTLFQSTLMHQTNCPLSLIAGCLQRGPTPWVWPDGQMSER
ncbi:hypothetical protein D3C87_1576210 [compost metagenome]